MTEYIYTTQNNIPYRLLLIKKDIKQTILEIAWTYNLFDCKKLSKKLKSCQSYILISSKFDSKKTDFENIQGLPVKKITIWKRLTGCVVIQQEITKQHSSVELDFLSTNNKIKWIKSWIKQQKCTSCGRIFSTTHNCDYKRSSFYYNQIAQSKNYWESIHFQPIGENENTKKIFIIYDIETFTFTEEEGVKLLPVLLCFSFFGDEDLTNIANEIISKDKDIKKKDNTYYWLSKEKNFVSNKFKEFRDNMLQRLIEKFLSHILTYENKEILTDFQKQKNLHSIFDINIENEKDLLMSLKVPTLFLELYIVGHNIQSFDEILLATQILKNNLQTYEPFLSFSRNFIPRQGKILFNDITISFPFPDYYVRSAEKENKMPEILEANKNGSPSEYSVKTIYVKSMVRDTFQITHTSLKNAALAYNLNINKGCCPFKAVNEYFSTNNFKPDSDSFPAEFYWTNKEEYLEQKKIWKAKNKKTYNIKSELIEYCCNDVIVTVELTKTLLKTFQEFITEEFKLNCKFNIFKRPTISSNSHAIFRQIHFSKHGKKPNKLPGIFAPSNEMYNFIRQSVRGGRCYPTHLGEFTEKIFVYDICGMYASALTHPLPYGLPVGEKEREEEIKKFSNLLLKKEKIPLFNNLKPMILSINAFPPPLENLDPLPPLCSKKSGKLCWTNEPLNNETVTSIDIITLHNRGWKVEILPNKLNTVFPEWQTTCAEYVKANILAKEKATKENNHVKRAISKLLSNALYGSFATKEENDLTVFESSLQEKKVKNQLEKNELTISSIISIPSDQLPKTKINSLQFNLKDRDKQEERYYHTDDELNSPFEPPEINDKETIPTSSRNKHVTTYKPFNILDVTSDSLTIYMLKSTSTFPTNKRYPTQLASFVLAWTRTFISEWAEILYNDENNIPIELKTVKAIYGDTDSLFLTEKGHILMQTKGQHRLKTENSNLIFNPLNPKITWAVECETSCPRCKNPAFCSKSIFLAPKLYALKDITCPPCKLVLGGKLRAKGHPSSDITFEILTECFKYHKNCSSDSRKYFTERTALKRTLCKSYGKFSPFSIHEIKLIRELRPWHDPTLCFISENKLIPYDIQHRNPRSSPIFLLQEFKDE